jgi:putative acetyltransferase
MFPLVVIGIKIKSLRLVIRPEQARDIEQIYQVNELAFAAEFESKLIEKLRQSSSFMPSLSLVAILDEQVAGHILFSKISIVSSAGTRVETLALAPIAVHPQMQRKGIGGQLIQQGLAEAQNLGFRSVIVLGHEHYYPKFGFRPAEQWQIEAPFEVPPAAFMAMELVPNGLANVSGIVEYPEAFG